MEAIEIKRDNRYILYDAELIENPEQLGFHPNEWAAQSAIIGFAEGRGTTFFVQFEGRDYVLRHYRRGGMVARLSPDRYIWTGIHKTRAWREWYLLAQLYEMNLPVPRPVAAQVIHNGLTYTADIMTMRISGSTTLAEELQRHALDAEVWHKLGALLYQFHKHGVWHADLNANNILRTQDGNLYLIDFDRGRFREPAMQWQQENLARLRRSLDKLKTNRTNFYFTESDWQNLLKGYVSLVSV